MGGYLRYLPVFHMVPVASHVDVLFHADEHTDGTSVDARPAHSALAIFWAGLLRGEEQVALWLRQRARTTHGLPPDSDTPRYAKTTDQR